MKEKTTFIYLSCSDANTKVKVYLLMSIFLAGFNHMIMDFNYLLFGGGKNAAITCNRKADATS